MMNDCEEIGEYFAVKNYGFDLFDRRTLPAILTKGKRKKWLIWYKFYDSDNKFESYICSECYGVTLKQAIQAFFYDCQDFDDRKMTYRDGKVYSDAQWDRIKEKAGVK